MTVTMRRGRSSVLERDVEERLIAKATTVVVTRIKMTLFAGKHGLEGNLTRGLALVALLVAASAFVALPARASSNTASQCQPDFTIAASPSSATVQRGSSVVFRIALTSVCGLSGSISVGVLAGGISPSGPNVPRLSVRNYDNWLPTNGKAGTIMTVITSQSTTPTTYTITLTGKDVSGGCCYGLTHTASVTLTVM
jgi:hypothetical protein